jgi:hypothetical protein
MVVYVGNHHPDVGERKLRRRRQLHTVHLVEGREFSKEETVVFPSQFHEVAAIAKKLESQETIELGGAVYVSDHDLGHELLCRIDVSVQG